MLPPSKQTDARKSQLRQLATFGARELHVIYNSRAVDAIVATCIEHDSATLASLQNKVATRSETCKKQEI